MVSSAVAPGGAATATGSTGSSGSTGSPEQDRRRRRLRGPAVLGVLVITAAVVLALSASGDRAGRLDPRAVDRSGSRAVAALLEREGIEVVLAETTDAAVAAATRDSNLLLAEPEFLVEEQLARIAATGADLVLVGPGTVSLGALAPWATLGGGRSDDPVAPLCGLPTAVRAGSVELPGALYRAQSGPGVTLELCYPRGDEAGLVVRSESGLTTTLLGSDVPLTNSGLAEEGNAALALGLLGGRERLVWYLPSPADVPESAREGIGDLVPRGVLFGAAQLGVAVLVAALWRARRLGPVLAEPLPVVVPASEAVEGRARLYRRGRARGRAAQVLRGATLERLGRSLGVPVTATAATLVDAVGSAARRPPEEVGALLYGAEPGDDTALVQLARALEALEEEVRRT